MANSNFDLVNIRLSRMMNDAVSAATSDGDKHTSAYRDKLLNNACRRMMLKWASVGQEDALRSLLNVEAQSLSSSVKALSSWTGGVMAVLSVYNVTDEQIMYPITNELKEEAQTGNDRYIRNDTDQQKYYLNAGNFTGIGCTASSSVRLTYVKTHTDLTAGDAAGNDLQVPSTYYDVILEEAYRGYLVENPSKENTVKLQYVNG